MIVAFTARNGHWFVVAAIGTCAIVAACSSSPEADNSRAAISDGDAGSDEPNTTEGTGTSSSSGALPPDAGRSNVGPDGTVRVAFIGDTGTGADFKSVLALTRREKADLLMIEGDLTYDGATAPTWLAAADTLNAGDAGTKIPFIAAKGNHDVGWSALADGLDTRYGKWGIAPDSNAPADRNYSVVYKGVRIVFVDQAETSPTRADYIKSVLAEDTHAWKICSWHKNMRATNVGPKNDEMPWAVYETCRTYGAIVAQGHSHTYSRSKTITNDTNQTVDTACSDPFALCVGPGKHFFFDSSLGGQDMRPIVTAIASKPYFATTFAASFGALFIDFNVDGDARKAQGYFKTTAGTIIDPPSSSGKTAFEITSTN